MTRVNRGKGKNFIINIVSGVILCFSLLMIVKTMSRSKNEEKVFEDLYEKYEAIEERKKNFISDKSSNIAEDTINNPVEVEPSIYDEFHALNGDYIAWLKVENTNINYPVMYTPDEPEFYLRRGFDKNYAESGTPFIGGGADINSDMFIIYGHNMSTGTMFNNLDFYKKIDFYEKTPSFTLETEDEKREYDVFAVIKTRVLDKDEKGYRFYYQTGDLNEEKFAVLVKWLKLNSLYDIDVNPEYGDQILILSTCSYHTADGRFIVAAKRTRAD